MRLITVVHGNKLEGLKGHLPQIAVNPPITVKGMEEAISLVEELKTFAPFATCYSSLAARTLDTASILCMEFGIQLRTMKELTAYSNKDEDEILYYPGYDQEDENLIAWQNQAVNAAKKIWFGHKASRSVLAVTHGPHIAGLFGHANDIKDEKGIRDILETLRRSGEKFLVFEMTNGNIAVLP